MRLFVISALVIALLAILFALQNTNLVTIQLFFWQYRQSLALVLLGTLAIGVIIGLLVSFPAIIRRNFRVTRIQKQADTLTELVQAKDQAIQVETRRVDSIKQNYGDLLRSLGVIEPVTGLLKADLVGSAIAAQLQQAQAEGGQGQPLSVLMFKVQAKIEDGSRPEAVFLAIARLLQQRASINTWFYSDGQGLFIATTPSLDLKAATRYGETLQAAILENLPALPSGQPPAVDVSVGGAIAESTAVDSHHLVATAESALEQALQRGRNRLRILSAA